MKTLKYKLIKEYPGSPVLGTIAEYTGSITYTLPDGKSYNESSSKGSEFEKLISSQTEYWEEVIEKDYEILSLIGINASVRRILNINTGLYELKHDKNDSYNLEHLLSKKGGYKIESIKRLSDGEVFTVGDDINYSYKGANNETITKEYKIERIYFIEKERLSFYVGNGLNLGIKNVLKLKQPLFTTEDGVDIYEGDKYFQLAVSFDPNFREAIYEEIARSNIKYAYNCKEGKEQLNKNGRYYFSTKEAAEEYIIMNKPCLSINDFIKANYGIDESDLLYVLKEKVKQKIK